MTFIAICSLNYLSGLTLINVSLKDKYWPNTVVFTGGLCGLGLQSLKLIHSSVDVVIFRYDLKLVCHQQLWDPDLHINFYCHGKYSQRGPMLHLHNLASERLTLIFSFKVSPSVGQIFMFYFMCQPTPRTTETHDRSEVDKWMWEHVTEKLKNVLKAWSLIMINNNKACHMSVCCPAHIEAARGIAAGLSIIINREMSLVIMRPWAFSEKPLIDFPQAARPQCCSHWLVILISALWEMSSQSPKQNHSCHKHCLESVLWKWLSWHVTSAKCQLESFQRAQTSAKTAY